MNNCLNFPVSFTSGLTGNDINFHSQIRTFVLIVIYQHHFCNEKIELYFEKTKLCSFWSSILTLEFKYLVQRFRNFLIENDGLVLRVKKSKEWWISKDGNWKHLLPNNTFVRENVPIYFHISKILQIKTILWIIIKFIENYDYGNRNNQFPHEIHLHFSWMTKTVLIHFAFTLNFF